jgi:hypothetical protein
MDLSTMTESLPRSNYSKTVMMSLRQGFMFQEYPLQNRYVAIEKQVPCAEGIFAPSGDSV